MRLAGIRSLRFIAAISGAALFILIISGSSSAHVPVYGSGGESFQDARVIHDPATSYAIFGEFDRDEVIGSHPHFFSVRAQVGDELYFQMNVPDLAMHELFNPVVLMIGPGLPYPTPSEQAYLDSFGIQLPEGSGVLRVDYTGPMTEEEFEGFGQVVYWVRQDSRLTTTQEGTFYFAILPVYIGPQNDMPSKLKYLFVSGYEENFGVMDFIVIPFDWIQTRMFWGYNPLIFMLPTFLTVSAGEAYLLLRMKSNTSHSVSTRSLQQTFVTSLGLSGGLLMVGGAINQMVFLLGSPNFSFASIGLLVLVFQVLGLVVGAMAIRMTMEAHKKDRWSSLVPPALLAGLALVLGAGFVVGPLIFLLAYAYQLVLTKGGSEV